MNEVATIASAVICRSQTRPLRVYLAGKISYHSPWRAEALADFGTKAASAPGAHPDNRTDRDLSFMDMQGALDPNATMRVNGPGGALDVIGPFFVSCDHGCAHDVRLHAVVGCNEEVHCLEPVEIREIREHVHAVNTSRIKRADLVFAHINETDCFGTISEIGYAHGVGTPVDLHFGAKLTKKQRDEMWFVAGFATIHEVVSVEKAFERALRLQGYGRGPQARSAP